jgi:hypothetical protein
MKMFIYILISTLLFSCGSKEQKITENIANTTTQQANEIRVINDTTIVYDIENISSEGAEAVVRYAGKKIKESTISIYGETGQAKIIYTFSPNIIKVTEKEFAYKEDLKKVSSDKDMKIKKEITYTIDLNGKLIGDADKERIDIFQEFKKAVPFELK